MKLRMIIVLFFHFKADTVFPRKKTHRIIQERSLSSRIDNYT